MKKLLTSFDLETHLIQPGLLAPPMVCGSFIFEAEGIESGEDIIYQDSVLLTDKEQICEFLGRSLDDPSTTITGANIAYDFAIVAAHKPSMLPAIFRAYDEGRVRDVLVGAALHYLESGLLFVDPRNFGPLKSPSTGKRLDRYSLEVVTDLFCNRVDAKTNDFWRLRYALLEGKPVEEWPVEARQYPIDDSNNTLDCARWLQEHGKNQQDHAAQARAAFALHLASVWGLRTDPEELDKLYKRVVSIRDGKDEPGDSKQTLHLKTMVRQLKANGLLSEFCDPVTANVKRACAVAYGASGVCSSCTNGKIKSEKTGNDVNCKKCSGTGLGFTTGLDAPRTSGGEISSCLALPRTATGGVAADRDTLKESGDELLEAFAQVSELQKLKTTYLPYLRTGVEVPINPRSNVLVATGRTSYSDLIQLLPREHNVRDCFVPRVGWVFCSVDYNALELCTLAQCQIKICGSSALAEALNAGLDPHTQFAANMYGMAYEDLAGQIKAGNKTAKNRRQTAKAANFGFPGGMGSTTLVKAQRKVGLRFCKAIENAERCGVVKVTEWRGKPTSPLCRRCVELAEDLKQSWFRQWPEMKRYFAFVQERVHDNGKITQLVSGRVRGGLDFCNAANTLFQGLAADGAKAALYNVVKEAYTDKNSPLFGARPVVFVHDEIVSELLKTNASNAAKRKAQIMIDTMRLYTPDVVIRAEPALMSRWLKEAEPVYDDKGELVVWKK